MCKIIKVESVDVINNTVIINGDKYLPSSIRVLDGGQVKVVQEGSVNNSYATVTRDLIQASMGSKGYWINDCVCYHRERFFIVIENEITTCSMGVALSHSSLSEVKKFLDADVCFDDEADILKEWVVAVEKFSNESSRKWMVL